MRLTSIELTNYRCHDGLKVEFQPGFNVVVGVNGSGKTSLLKSICDVLTGFTKFAPLRDHSYNALVEPGIARLKVEAPNGRFRFEPQYPVKVTATAELSGNSCKWSVVKSTQAEGAGQISGNPPGEFWHPDRSERLPGDPERSVETDLPVIAFYRANRHWGDTRASELQAATHRDSKADGYKSWADASADASALQRWVIAKSLERLQISSETSTSFDKVDSDELALVNVAIASAIENAKGLRYDLIEKSLLVEWLIDRDMRSEPTPFENLSDGQRAVIGLVADIARRMCLLNPELGQQVTSKTPGVVLIDELDMHLHPRWQRIVTKALKSAFPAVQFIVASHSPQVLGELQPSEIILLRTGGTGHPQVSYGLDSSSVLEEIMDAPARSDEVADAVSNLFESLERNELDLAQQQLAQLKTMAPGIVEIAGAEALLRRKEVLGR